MEREKDKMQQTQIKMFFMASFKEIFACHRVPYTPFITFVESNFIHIAQGQTDLNHMTSTPP